MAKAKRCLPPGCLIQTDPGSPDCRIRIILTVAYRFLADASEETPYSYKIGREKVVRDLVVPEILAFRNREQHFVSYHKRKRINELQVSEYLRLLKALPIRVETQPELGSCTYDASYPALVLRNLNNAQEPFGSRWNGILFYNSRDGRLRALPSNSQESPKW
jgi:hypothetical protein